MTHDDLLGIVNRLLHLGKGIEALKAVIELHKPEIGPSEKLYCLACARIEYGFLSYPCPTIQAIENILTGSESSD